jgi:hypothetical protein
MKNAVLSNEDLSAGSAGHPVVQYVSWGGHCGLIATRPYVRPPLKALPQARVLADTSLSLRLQFYILLPVEMSSASENGTNFNKNCHSLKYSPF